MVWTHTTQRLWNLYMATPWKTKPTFSSRLKYDHESQLRVRGQDGTTDSIIGSKNMTWLDLKLWRNCSISVHFTSGKTRANTGHICYIKTKILASHETTVRSNCLSFGFYSSHCIYRRRIRSYQHTAFAVLDTYDTLYGTHKTDARVGSGCRRRFLDWYGFRFSTTLRNMFVIELRDSIVFSVVQTVMEFERIGWV
jgi:hypothetical protein